MNSPAVSTIKRLFALSGDQCAFPNCPLSLVDGPSGKVIGKVCHIKARQPGGRRYDANQSDAERHEFDNLLLLCPIHHDVIDSDVESYSVQRLVQIKLGHETVHQNGQEPTDEIANTLIANISSNSFSDGSLLLTSNQTGGQVAHQISNFLLQPNASAALEREIQVRRDTHDLEIFRKSDSILDEDGLDRGLSILLGDHSDRDDFFVRMDQFCAYFGRVQNHYLNSNLAKLSSDMAVAIWHLKNFLVYNFFDYPERQPATTPTTVCIQIFVSIVRAEEYLLTWSSTTSMLLNLRPWLITPALPLLSTEKQLKKLSLSERYHLSRACSGAVLHDC